MQSSYGAIMLFYLDKGNVYALEKSVVLKQSTFLNITFSALFISNVNMETHLTIMGWDKGK